jgi:hypothetical protein
MKTSVKNSRSKGRRKRTTSKGSLYRALAEAQVPEDVVRSYRDLTDGSLAEAYGLNEFADSTEPYQNVAFVERVEQLDDAYDHDNESDEIIHIFGGGD